MKKVVCLFTCLFGFNFSLNSMGDDNSLLLLHNQQHQPLMYTVCIIKSTSTDSLKECPVSPRKRAGACPVSPVPTKTNAGKCPVSPVPTRQNAACPVSPVKKADLNVNVNASGDCLASSPKTTAFYWN